MKWVIAYAVCPVLACVILWLRQGRFIAYDIQVVGAIALGPLSVPIALFTPRDMLTSREKSEANQ